MNRDDIVRVLDQIGAEKVRVFRKNVQCACVLANYRSGHSADSDHEDSMGVSIDPDGVSLVHCFSCKFRGTLSIMLKVLAKESGRDLQELIKQVEGLEAQDLGTMADSIPAYEVPIRGRRSEDDGVLPNSFLDEFSGGTHGYIVRRGLSVDTCCKWDTRLDQKKKRVVFPVRREDYSLVGAIGRTINGHKIRYLNYWDFVKTKYLFGIHMNGGGDIGVIMEGVLDTVGVWQELKAADLLGKYTPVGIMGSEASLEQVRQVSRRFSSAVIFLDNDAAGWTGVRRLSEELRRFIPVGLVRYPDDLKDPMDLISWRHSIPDIIGSANWLL